MATTEPSLKDMAKAKMDEIPPWARIAIGVITIFALFKLTPILDLLAIFFQIVLIPLAFIGGGWLVAGGGIEAVANHYKSLVGKVADEAEEKVKNTRKKAA
jgi:predicted DNA repair protein MutK